MNKIIKNIYLVLLFGIMVSTIMSCEEDKSLESFDPLTPELSFNKESIDVSKLGGDESVSITSNLPWRAKTNASWITLSSENALGDGILNFSVVRNRTTEERRGEIILSITNEYSKKITVVQEASDASDLITNYYVTTTGIDSNDGLSWSSPISLSKAFDEMGSGDVIHIAAGTYAPLNKLTGGTDEGDITFEIHSNVTIIGGYPENAVEGATPDPQNNKTILSGENRCYHVLTITAPVETGKKVVVEGVTIKNGLTAASGSVSVGGVTYSRSNGGGISIGKSVAEFVNCAITDNTSNSHAAGIYVHNGAIVKFINSDITDNKGISTNGSNGGGLFNESSTVYLINCNVLRNSVTGVAGGLYSYSAGTLTYMYVFNSTIANNTNTAGTNTSRRGGGYYAREFTRAYIVNSTFTGNTGGLGAGISIYGASGKTSEVYLISSTVTGNSSIGAIGGVEVLANTTLNSHNSIISGNTSGSGNTDLLRTGAVNLAYSIEGAKILNASGADSGQVFDPATMLSPIADNGGRTQTCMLSSSSPAAQLGMNDTDLKNLGLTFNPAIDASVMTFDQRGESRSGKTAIGAVAP